jgi:predicted nucleic acid-binding protein
MAKVTQFIDAGPTVADLTRGDAEAAGLLRADLSARGQMIGAYDLLIAGQGLARGWTGWSPPTHANLPGRSV